MHARIPTAAAAALTLLGLTIAAPAGAATLTVANCNDQGTGSLRDAAALAQDGDVIDLRGLTCSRVLLTSGPILFAQRDVTLQGPGRARLAIDGGGRSAVLRHPRWTFPHPRPHGALGPHRRSGVGVGRVRVFRRQRLTATGERAPLRRSQPAQGRRRRRRRRAGCATDRKPCLCEPRGGHIAGCAGAGWRHLQPEVAAAGPQPAVRQPGAVRRRRLGEHDGDRARVHRQRQHRRGPGGAIGRIRGHPYDRRAIHLFGQCRLRTESSRRWRIQLDVLVESRPWPRGRRVWRSVAEHHRLQPGVARRRWLLPRRVRPGG